MTEPSGLFSALRYDIGYVPESNEDSVNVSEGDSGRGMWIVPTTLVTDRPSNIKSYVLSAKNTYGKVEWLPNYIKRSVRVTSIGDIDLDTVSVIDDVALVFGDRVLVRDQTDPTENGIYVYQDPGLTRSTDAQETMDASLISVFCSEGTVNFLSLWTVIDDAVLFGEALTFYKVAGGNFGGPPGNPVNSVQFNNAGTFGGSADFLWNTTDLTVAVPVLVTDTTNSASAGTGALIVSGGVGIAQDVVCAGSVSADFFVTTSDREMKDHISPIYNASDIIATMHPVQYTLKKDPRGRINYGLLAQDLLENEHLKDLVWENNENSGINYMGLVGLLLASQQELLARIRGQ